MLSCASSEEAIAATSRLSTVALIGNPNTGKTTLFNAFTGLFQRVGNFPGVTVERKIGRMQVDERHQVNLLDLPGTYSLAARAPDEAITVEVLLGRRPDTPQVDAVLAIVDAANLKRNLYLVSQLLETGLPVVIALNMIDVAAARGIQVDAAALAARLGAPVVPICAHRRQGLEVLRQALARVLEEKYRTAVHSRPPYPAPFGEQVAILVARPFPAADGTVRHLSFLEALRLLIDEGGYLERQLVQELGRDFAVWLAERRTCLRKELNGDESLAAVESAARYAWIQEVIAGSVHYPDRLRPDPSDRIDRFLTHRFFGTLVFVVVSAAVFQSIYAWSGPLMEAIETFFGKLGNWIVHALPEGALRSLLVDGIIAGVGSVLVFLPQIAILFFFISVLEDCGYMARAALLMDRLLTLCGLSGKSFIPLLSSFACAVPGIMATRTIEDRKDRLATILVAPLMSCSARLPIYVLFIAAFVPERPVLVSWFNLQGATLLVMYLLGILLAVPTAWVIKKFLLKGDPPPFLMELPPYLWPSLRSVLLRVYHNSRAFVVRAGSIIMATTVVMWALAYFPRSSAVMAKYEEKRLQVLATCAGEGCRTALEILDHQEAAELLEHSLLGKAGHLLEPAVRPLGWDWRIGMATLASFPAREVVISTLGTICNLGIDPGEGGTDLRLTLHRTKRPDGTLLFTLPVALSIMIFFALCAQCLSTLVTIQRETGSWRWAVFAFGYLTLLAYLGAFAVYQGANHLGWGE